MAIGERASPVALALEIYRSNGNEDCGVVGLLLTTTEALKKENDSCQLQGVTMGYLYTGSCLSLVEGTSQRQLYPATSSLRLAAKLISTKELQVVTVESLCVQGDGGCQGKGPSTADKVTMEK